MSARRDCAAAASAALRLARSSGTVGGAATHSAHVSLPACKVKLARMQLHDVHASSVDADSQQAGCGPCKGPSLGVRSLAIFSRTRWRLCASRASLQAK